MGNRKGWLLFRMFDFEFIIYLNKRIKDVTITYHVLGFNF